MTNSEILAAIFALLPQTYAVSSEWEEIISIGNYTNMDCMAYHITGFASGLRVAGAISIDNNIAIGNLVEQLIHER